ncbi:MAG: hypothetical protein ABIO45_15870 [Burkholderiaceae bacterium]
MQQILPHIVCLRTMTLALALALAFASAGAWAQERVSRPAPVPSPSIGAPANLEAPRLPSGTDTGVPGSGQKPALTGNVRGDNTPRKLAQRRGADPAASAARVDDRAAARAAGRSTTAASAAR